MHSLTSRNSSKDPVSPTLTNLRTNPLAQILIQDPHILLEAKCPEIESHILAFHNQRLKGLKKVERKDGLGIRYSMNITGKSRRQVRSMIEMKTNTKVS